RIGFKCILEPYSFILLIVRQCYPHEWYGLINVDEVYQEYKPILAKYKNVVEGVGATFLNFKDSLEFYLT
ncbi:MAG TPA: hypothetical protein VL978_17580, partial [Puia sp.]|nr:hypothetical protein [Puia sp.]